MLPEKRRQLYRQARRKALRDCAANRANRNLLIMARLKLLDARANYYP